MYVVHVDDKELARCDSYPEAFEKAIELQPDHGDVRIRQEYKHTIAGHPEIAATGGWPGRLIKLS